MKRFCRGWRCFPLALLLATGCETEKAASHFGGKDLSGWRPPTGEWKVAKAVSLDANDASKFVVTSGTGVFVNGDKGKTTHFVTEAGFGDAEIHVEFCIPKNSNSGVYVMGRY